MLPSHQWYGIIPGWLLFYALIAVAAVLFGRRAFYLLRLLLKGKPLARWDHIPARVGRVIVYVFGQARLLANDFWPGLMHATIFWGFVILTLGTVEFFGKGGHRVVLPAAAVGHRALPDRRGRVQRAGDPGGGLRDVPPARHPAPPPEPLHRGQRDPAADPGPHGHGPGGRRRPHRARARADRPLAVRGAGPRPRPRRAARRPRSP